jgi:hypothetical protein
VDRGRVRRRAADITRSAAQHLADPIVSDAHEAMLELGDGEAAHLEREGSRWVVVDF